MKLRFTYWYTLLSLAVLLSSCLGKDEENNPQSHIEYQDKSFPMMLGTYVSQQLEVGSFSHVITLTNVGADNFSADMEVASFTLMINTSANELVSGTYLYQEDIEAEGIVLAGFTFGQTYNDPYSATQLHLSAGSVSLEKSGDKYVLEISMEDDNGNSLSGYFNGPLITQ